MKKTMISFCAFMLAFIICTTTIGQTKATNHSFKITGKSRITIYEDPARERMVEFDSTSLNHLIISEFRNDGYLVLKTHYKFDGKNFNLTNFNDYLNNHKLERDGLHQLYSGFDILEGELLYQDGKVIQAITYYDNGNKNMFLIGDENTINGAYKIWYKNGQLNFSGNYSNNLKDGLFQLFDETGKLIREGHYEKGKLVSGVAVVQDLIYEDPEVKASFAGGETAFNKMMKEKSENLTSVKSINKNTVRFYDLSLIIDENGKVIKIDLSAQATPTNFEINNLTFTESTEFLPATKEDVEIINSVFSECSGFLPATKENIPVKSLLNMQVQLSNKGIEPLYSEIEEPEASSNDTLENKVFTDVEEMPEFPAGQLAFRKYIAQSIRYPVYAQEKGIQGKVFVGFIINTDGSISNVRVSKGVHPLLDAEAVRVVRVVSNSPDWNPGKIGGKPVRVKYTVPITFYLQ